jgi:hypothetical protein
MQKYISFHCRFNDKNKYRQVTKHKGAISLLKLVKLNINIKNLCQQVISRFEGRKAYQISVLIKQV